MSLRDTAQRLWAPAAGGQVRRASIVMATGTVASRATGLVRQVLQAAALGTGLLASAYATANAVPTILFTLVVGGALNAVLVPQLVQARLREDDRGLAFEQRLVTAMLLLLGAGAVVAVWGAPLVVALYMPDTPAGHDAYELTVLFARFLLPQVFFYGMVSVLGQLLNARERFTAVTWTPVLNNIVVTAVFVLYLAVAATPQGVRDLSPAHIRLLGIGTTVGIAVQAFALLPALRAAGFRWRLRLDWRGTGMGAALRSARWAFLLVLANQAAVLVVTRYANAADQVLPDAGVGYSAYYSAQLVWTLPQTIVTVSVATAMLPRMSAAFAEGRIRAFRADLSRALSATGAVIVPAAFGSVALGPELARLLFAHGASDPAAATMIGHIIQALGLGLIPYSAQFVLLRGFHATGDTRTPFVLTAWIAGLNIVLATGCHLLFPPRWVVTAMAAAYSASYGVGLALTARRLRLELGEERGRGDVLAAYGHRVVASAVGGGCAWVVARLCATRLPTGPLSDALAVLVGTCILAASCWVGMRRTRERIGDRNA